MNAAICLAVFVTKTPKNEQPFHKQLNKVAQNGYKLAYLLF